MANNWWVRSCCLKLYTSLRVAEFGKVMKSCNYRFAYNRSPAIACPCKFYILKWDSKGLSSTPLILQKFHKQYHRIVANMYCWILLDYTMFQRLQFGVSLISFADPSLNISSFVVFHLLYFLCKITEVTIIFFTLTVLTKRIISPLI